MKGNLNKYKQLCEIESTIPLFSQYWWLQTVAPDQWDVCIVENNGIIEASMPYCIKRRAGFVMLTQPALTQTIGPWIRNSNINLTHKILSREISLHKELIKQLPCYDYFRQNWSYVNKNWMGFYLQGFKQTTRYTYRFNNIGDLNLIWEGMRKNIRSDINKARNKFKLMVDYNSSIEEFMVLYRETFSRQKKNIPYDENIIIALSRVCEKKIRSKILIAKDQRGCNYAGVFLVWDDSTVYYLMGGSDNRYRSSGASSLCIWEAINFAKELGKSFDFEGSMIPSVSKYFRAFGAEQFPYFTVSKSNSKVLDIFTCLFEK